MILQKISRYFLLPDETCNGLVDGVIVFYNTNL